MIIALYVSLIAFVVVSAFIVASTFKRLLEEDIELMWWLKVIAVVWVVIGYPADVAFNFLFGTIIFRELPKWGEWLFTHRLQRHYFQSTDWRHDKASQWRVWVNAVDTGHM